MPTTSRKDGIEMGNGIRGGGDVARVHWFHESRGGHQKRGIACTAGGWDDLTSAAENRLLGERDVHYFEFCVADGCRDFVNTNSFLLKTGLLTFFAKRTFSTCPREPLFDGIPHRV